MLLRPYNFMNWTKIAAQINFSSLFEFTVKGNRRTIELGMFICLCCDKFSQLVQFHQFELCLPINISTCRRGKKRTFYFNVKCAIFSCCAVIILISSSLIFSVYCAQQDLPARIDNSFWVMNALRDVTNNEKSSYFFPVNRGKFF